jgi:hypothetical protein
MSPRLISVLRKPSVCSLFKNRLSSEGRIPGCILINESTLSRSSLWRPCFADLTDRALCLTNLCVALVPVLDPCDLRFIAVVLLVGYSQSSRSLGKLPLLVRSRPSRIVADFRRTRYCCTAPGVLRSLSQIGQKWHVGLLLLGSWRFGFQIDKEATNTHSQPKQWILQCHDGSRPEDAQGRDRPQAHDPALAWGDVVHWSPIDKLNNQANVSCVYEEEDRGIEGNWLRRQPTYGHPSGGKWRQRHGKQMREIKPHETRSGLRGIAHKMMVIDPNDGDEKITDRITEPCRPERKECFKGGEFRRTQFQDQHRYQDSEHAIGERAQSLRGPSHVWHGRHPLLQRYRFDARPNSEDSAPLPVRPTSPRRHPCEALCRSSSAPPTIRRTP